MRLQKDAVQEICHAVSRQMRDYARNLDLSFIIHQDGQNMEALTFAGQELLSHPGAGPALRLLKKAKQRELSSFIGLCAWRENMLLGLASTQVMMALITINSDEFADLRDVSGIAWSMGWHAIHLYDKHKDPAYEETFDNGVITPDKTTHNKALTNLKADVFSAAMCAMNGDRDMIGHLAKTRSLQALERNAHFKPELFPFALTMEATRYAYDEMMKNPPARKKQINAALQLAENVAQAYDDLSLRQWTDFCKPAQDMAWRGADRETILGAAVSTSKDTNIRATGFLVASATGIKPASLLSIENIYTPFAEDQHNRQMHEALMEQALERAIGASLTSFNSAAFIEIANEQNQKLVGGHILGWCASALQAAARTFDMAVTRGSKTPEIEARREFEGAMSRTTWDSLKEIGENIIEQYRQGYASTFNDVLDFCGERPAFAGISGSVAFTLKDPGYLKKLSIANDMDMRATPSPRSQFAMTAAPKPSPITTPAISFPGLGFGTSEVSRPPPAKEPVD